MTIFGVMKGDSRSLAHIWALSSLVPTPPQAPANKLNRAAFCKVLEIGTSCGYSSLRLVQSSGRPRARASILGLQGIRPMQHDFWKADPQPNAGGSLHMVVSTHKGTPIRS